MPSPKNHLPASFEAVLSRLGQQVEMTVEFTTFERPRVIEEVTHLSTMEIEGGLRFEPVPDGTKLHWSWELHPRGGLKLLTPLVTRMGTHQEERIWTELKRCLNS